MKFTNGYWDEKPEYKISKPIEVVGHDWNGEKLTIYVCHRRIQNKGAFLNQPVTTVTFKPVGNEIIKVTYEHFRGIYPTGPEYELDEAISLDQIRYVEDEATLTLRNGLMKVIVQKQPYCLKFYYDEVLMTQSEANDCAYIIGANNKDTNENSSLATMIEYTHTASSYYRERLSLDIGESVYGLGERFTSFVKNGQSVDIWNEDAGTGSQLTYKNIPFYVTSKGYGVFVNHPEKVSFEVASEMVNKVQFSVLGEKLVYYVIGGGDVKAVINNYTALTGRPSLPPKWSYGLWLTTSFTTDYDEETINYFVDGMAERNIPLSVFHFDCFWMKGFHWCDFEWDRTAFPDPEGMIKRLKAKGLKICVWINPYIAGMSPLFKEGMEKGYLLKKKDGNIWQTDLWQAGMGIVDFTNAEARNWYKGHLQKLIDMGVDSFKTDFGERIPVDVVYHDKSDPVKMHNYYTYIYNKAVFELLEANYGVGEAALFARSATAGCQKFPVHWGGDCSSNYSSMSETLRGGLSLAMSGFAFWSHDISGFEKSGTPDLYKRWVAFGLLSSHSRLHGAGSYRVPWLFDEESVDVLRYFVNLKEALMPYLMSVAEEAKSKGLPMMRPMVMEFPEDRNCHYLDLQYMLGDKLLVAPIFNDQGIARYYLPQGQWQHLLNESVVEGGRWYEESYDYFSLPLFVREGMKELVLPSN